MCRHCWCADAYTNSGSACPCKHDNLSSVAIVKAAPLFCNRALCWHGWVCDKCAAGPCPCVTPGRVNPFKAAEDHKCAAGPVDVSVLCKEATVPVSLDFTSAQLGLFDVSVLCKEATAPVLSDMTSALSVQLPRDLPAAVEATCWHDSQVQGRPRVASVCLCMSSIHQPSCHAFEP